MKMDLRGIRWEGADWTDLAQYRFQWRSLMSGNGNEISGVI